MKVAVVLPSRGLIFSEVLQSIEESQLPDISLSYFISSTLPIPDNLNYLVDRALKTTPNYIWFVEEDTVPPPMALPRMLLEAQKNPLPSVVCIDYPLSNGASSIWTSKTDGSVQFCGFGCTLVDARIFEKLERPFFRTDMELLIGEGVGGNESRWVKVSRKETYGKHDIHFFKTVRDKGFSITKIPGECRHLKLEEPGKVATNNGLHKIGLKSPAITIRYTL